MTSAAIFLVVAVVAVGLTVRGFFRAARQLPALFASIGITYSLVSKQVSLAYIEIFPSYLPELRIHSSANGASLRIFAMHAILVSSILGTARWLETRHPVMKQTRDELLRSQPTIQACTYCMLGISTLIVLQWFNLALSLGTALPGADFDRYNFWQDSARFPVLASILGDTMAFVCPTVALAYWKFQRSGLVLKSRLALITLLPYFAFLFATGHRFTIPLLNGGLFLSTLAIARTAEGRRPIPAQVGVAVVAAAGFSLAVGTVDLTSRHFAQSTSGAGDAFVTRALVIQGSTLWAVDESSSSPGFEPLGPTVFLDGMEAIRGEVLPGANAQRYANRNVNLSAGLPAAVQLALGNLGGVFVLTLFGAFFALVFHIFAHAVASGRFAALAPASLVLAWGTSVYGLASLTLVLTANFAILLAALGFMTARRRLARVNLRVTSLESAPNSLHSAT